MLVAFRQADELKRLALGMGQQQATQAGEARRIALSQSMLVQVCFREVSETVVRGGGPVFNRAFVRTISPIIGV
jgi:hypothetical protein